MYTALFCIDLGLARNHRSEASTLALALHTGILATQAFRVVRGAPSHISML
jgi:hypothetical protein